MKSRPRMPGARGWKSIVSSEIRIQSIGPMGRPTKERHILKPGDIAHALVQQHPIGHRGTFPQITTRSILARLGVEVNFSQEQVPKLLSGDLPHLVTLTHKGHIPIRLRRGNRTHRVYYPHLALPVRREEAEWLAEKGHLVLGSDFKWLPSGILEISPHAVKYEIPSHEIESLSKIKWPTGSKRKLFMGHLTKKRVPLRTESGKIILTETHYVKLPPTVGMVFWSATDGISNHIHSLFIDPGYEGPIVMELFGIQDKVKPEKVLAHLIRPIDGNLIPKEQKKRK